MRPLLHGMQMGAATAIAGSVMDACEAPPCIMNCRDIKEPETTSLFNLIARWTCVTARFLPHDHAFRFVCTPSLIT